MMKLFRFVWVIFFSVCLSGTVFAQWSGNKKITREVRKVAPFSAIELTGRMEVLITQGNEYAVTIETDENLQENITTDVRNNTLRISAKARSYSQLRVHITLVDVVYIESDRAHVILANPYQTKQLTVGVRGSGSFLAQEGFTAEDLTVNLYGGSTAGGLKPFTVYNRLMINSLSGSVAEMNVMANRMEIEASSAARITLEGKCGDLTAVATAAGKIEALRMTVERAFLKATTAARIQVYVTESVQATKKSAATLEIAGNPPKQSIL